MKPKVESCACLLISKYSSTLFSKDGCPVSNHMNPSIFDHFKAPFFSFAIYVICMMKCVSSIYWYQGVVGTYIALTQMFLLR